MAEEDIRLPGDDIAHTVNDVRRHHELPLAAIRHQPFDTSLLLCYSLVATPCSWMRRRRE